MTKFEAEEIARLINNRNQLTKKYSYEEILSNSENFVYLKEEEKIVACAESKKVQWYQFEILHVSIAQNFEGKGFGNLILNLAEKNAIEKNAKILQCTIRTNNDNSIRLFTRKGYKQVNSFFNNKSGNWIFIYQKTIANK